jgi:alpha-ketoglutaric semialdehyde dehydrogenase
MTQPMTPTVDNLIAGHWRSDGELPPAEDRDPADDRDLLALVPSLGPAQVTAAIDAAAHAFPGWRATPATDRGAILLRAAELLRQRRDEVARDISRENGKTLGEAGVEVDKSADFLAYYAGVGRLPYGDLLDDGRPGTLVMTRREPLGAVVIITPWNDPLLTPARKLSPALITGNTVVLKPAPETPLAMYHLARALHDAGLPAGVLSTVTGDPEVIGAALLDDPRVRAVSLTGSGATGNLLERRLAGRPVRFEAEMGGKNAAVVLADADLDLAVSTIAAAAFAQAGQRCTAASRVFAEDAILPGLLKQLVTAARSHRLGPGTADGTTMGPLISRPHRDKVLAGVRAAAGGGATVLCGGTAPQDPRLAHGCFFEPTVVTDAGPELAIWRDELFGPVVAVAATGGLDEAVAAVNDSPFGLSAALFTSQVGAAHRFIEEVDTGQVSVNLPTSGWDVHHPFGGFKASGSAFKEQGLEGVRFYTKVKTAALRHSTGGAG